MQSQFSALRIVRRGLEDVTYAVVQTVELDYVEDLQGNQKLSFRSRSHHAIIQMGSIR